jgi:hypothetical protein
MTSDQFWSIFAMPIGLMICFTPIVVAWLLAEPDEPASQPAKPKH